MKVPLDYTTPDGKTIDVKISKSPAIDKKSGSLVVNPGGPGIPGIGYAELGGGAFTTDVVRHYDLVGFDPRGVGASTRLNCMDTEQTDQLMAFDPDPDGASERRRMDALYAAFGRGCLKKSGDLERHMSTVEVAKDMDVLRQLLDEPKLTSFGLSYGTYLGATYARLSPATSGGWCSTPPSTHG